MTAPAGHTVDAHTVALYRFNEAATGDAFADVSGNGLNIPAISGNVIGPGYIDGSRKILAAQYPDVALSNAIRDRLTGAMSIERWVRWEGWGYYGSGVAADSNHGTDVDQIFFLDITPQGKIRFEWQAADLSFPTGTTSFAIPPFRPTHIEFARRIVTGQAYVDISINGGQQLQTFGPFELPIVNPGIKLYFRNVNGTKSEWLEDTRISDIVRTPAEFLASYNAGVAGRTTPLGHKLDANTVALFRLDEGGDGGTDGEPVGAFQDVAGGVSLDVITGASHSLRAASGITGGPAPQWSTLSYPTAPAYLRATTTLNAAALTTFHSGTFTLEWWWHVPSFLALQSNRGHPTQQRIFGAIVTYNLGGAEADNMQISMEINPEDRGLYPIFQYGAAGSYAYGTNFLPNMYDYDAWQHLTVRCTATSGTEMTVEIFRDKILLDTRTGVRIPTGGANQKWIIGNSLDGLSCNGAISDLRFSNIARTDLEIAESVDRGMGVSGGGEAAPVVTLVQPTGAEQDPSAPLIVRVVDPLGLAAVVVLALFPESNTYDVLYDSDTFGTNYPASSNSKEPITNGFEWTFRRAGGFPVGLKTVLKVIAVNNAGVIAS